MKAANSPPPEVFADARAAALAEWDATVPRWSMPREEFADWMVRCVLYPKSFRKRRNG